MTKKHFIIIGSTLAAFGVAVSWLGSNAQKIPGLKHADPFVVQAVVLVIGVIAAAVMTWIMSRGDKTAEGAGGGGGAAEAPAEVTDMDELLAEAEARLAVAQQEKDSKIGKLPAIILLGESGSAKTTTMVQSGAEPESLSGQVYEENNILPTPAANFWFAHHTVFVEMGGKVLADNNAWKTLIGGLQPSKAAALLGTAEEVSRAALVCVDAETLNSPSPDPLAALARKLRTQLAEISRLLGINLPVYVLFTRSDRLLFFTEYFSKLNNEEATRILGSTLPIVTERKGIYAEGETTRLGAAFERLFRKLCNARPRFLARETEPMQLSAMYEFPREFRKIHQAVVRFLVELCRPSQITVGPFLRGFYFSGVRPVMVNEVAPATPLAPTPAAGGRMGATGMFRAQAAAAAAAGAQRIVGQRKVPQWLFLSHFFNDLLLADTAAKGASSSSIRASMPRRILLLTASLLCLIYSVCLLVSFGKNRALANNVKLASAGINAAAPPAAGEAASLDSLKKLETLRQSLEVLTKYNRHGAPLGYRWGLYIGNDLYPDVRKLYFADFHRLLLAPTQDTMVAQMRALPGTPGPNDDYTGPYKSLKAYLETTSNHEKATHDFLPPVLTDRWGASRNVDPERIALAQKQLEFYSDELQLANPYASDNDAAAIGNARHYLNQFGGLQRVYQAMLADAAKAGQPLNFNKRFPGSAEEVIDDYTVQAAFTKPGWDFMKAALKDPGKYFEGEAWVLGPQSSADVDRSKLAQQLASLYYADYNKEWRNYMKAAKVVPYAGLPDASKKLGVTSGNQSPLLELFWLASGNTAVDVPDVANAFQPLAAVVPPSTMEKFFAPPNQAYMGTLVTLQGSLDALAQQPNNNDAGKNTTLSNATAAHGAAKQVSLTFNPDTSEAHVDATVLKLMNDPITYVENLLRSLGPAQLNAAGRNFCGEFRAMFAKFPFNRTSKSDATVDDVNAIFKTPDGKFWKFYGENLTKLLPKQGSDYAPQTVDGVTLTPGFVAFFKKAAAFGESLYAGNTPDPHFSYTLKSVQSDGIDGAVLSLDGQQVSYSGSNMVSKTLNWQGTASATHGVKATYKRGGDNDWDTEDGLWAIFKFFYQADRTVPAAGGGYTLEWVMRSGKDAKPVMIEGGKELTVRFQADVPMFQKDFFASMACVADVAKQ
jgi:type VI secretion system protein ImpL